MAIMQRMIQFAERILELDMGEMGLRQQQGKYGMFVKRKLPIDSATSPQPVPFIQLMETIGNYSDQLLGVMDKNMEENQQDFRLLCAAGASGIGKTHAAYSIGRSRICILVRLCEPGSHRTNNMSKPWHTAYQKVTNVFDDKNNASISRIDLASNALRVMKLLVYCYVEANCIIASCVNTPEQRRELVLRYNRNGTCEEQVNELFLERFQACCREGESFPNEDECAKYFETVIDKSAKLLGENFVLCFDEILVLGDLLESQFFSRSHFLATEDCKSNEEAIGKPTQNATHGSVVERGLLYATICCILSISFKNRWRTFVTGTSLSLSRFSSHPLGISGLRGATIAVSPEVLLKVDDMIGILKHYFHWESDTFHNQTVLSKLYLCAGRPLFFSQSVLQPLLSRVMGGGANTAKKLDHRVLTETIDVNRSRDSMCRILDELFDNPQPLPPNYDKTTKPLLPILIRSILSNDEVFLTSEELESAVRVGIFPVSITSSKTSLVRGLEPIVRDVCCEKISYLSAESFDTSLLRSIAGAEKGQTAESFIANRIALRSFYNQMKLKTPIRLDALLKDFLPVEQHNLLNDQFGRMYCHVDTLVDLKNAPKDDTFLENFVIHVKRTINPVRTWKNLCGIPHSDSRKLDFKSVFINVDTSAGVDICFLVTFDSSVISKTVTYHVVAIQANPQRSGTLDDALLSIHPGTQYLPNALRSYLLDWRCEIPPELPSVRHEDGVQGSKWKNHLKFCKLYPSLGKDWVRVVITALPLADSLLSRLSELASGTYVPKHLQPPAKPKDRQKWATDIGIIRSPIAVVSLHAADSSVVGDASTASAIQTDTTWSLPTTERHWAPLNVTEVERIVKVAGLKDDGSYA